MVEEKQIFYYILFYSIPILFYYNCAKEYRVYPTLFCINYFHKESTRKKVDSVGTTGIFHLIILIQVLLVSLPRNRNDIREYISIFLLHGKEFFFSNIY
jgi:hypothetical protein